MLNGAYNKYFEISENMILIKSQHLPIQGPVKGPCGLGFEPYIF